ncbi:MAG: hypothetical protein ACE5FU_06950 [Nitrospinota bacterium]
MKRALECIVLLLTLLGASYSLKPFIGALYLSFGKNAFPCYGNVPDWSPV